MFLVIILRFFDIRCSEDVTYGFKTIKSASDPTLYVTSFKKIFRLKKTFVPLTGLESNVVKFEAFDNGYKILVNDEPMCLASDNNPTIVSCSLQEDQKLTKWHIDETPQGAFIRTKDGLCLSGGVYDDRDSTDGYGLTIEKCDSAQAGLWIIRPIEALVSNGDVSKNAESQNQNGRPNSILDFADHNPGSNLTLGWQPIDKSAVELPENINGF